MATKTWRLVVTELGDSAPLSDVSVEATNWMTAIKTGRTAMGEDGGVPPGASCAVAPNGHVTIHDPIARKTYLLTPGARVAAPSVAPNPAPEPAAPQPVAAPVPQPEKRVSKKTISYNINDHGPIGKPQQPGDIVVGNGTGDEPPAPALVVEAPAPVVEAPAPVEAKVAAPAAPAAPAPIAATPEPTPLRKVSKKTISYNINDHGPIKIPAEDATREPAPLPKEQDSKEGTSLELLRQRGEDPSDKSPLHYREQIYVAPKGTSNEDAEDLIRARFGMLRAELDGKPPGKFFNLAVFDHHWEARPSRRPIVTLQWKDWHGTPVIDFPLNPTSPVRAKDEGAPVSVSAKSSPPPAQPATTAAVPPAPTSAPVSEPTASETVSSTPEKPAEKPAEEPAEEPPKPTEATEPAAMTAQGPTGVAPAAVALVDKKHTSPAAEVVTTAPAQPTAAPTPGPAPAAQPAPAPAPTPEPAPAAQPAPVPTPEPAPVAQHAPEPAAQPTPAPVPTRRRATTGETDDRLAAAFEASQDLLFLSTPFEGLEFAMRLLGELIPSEASSACLYDINTDEFRFVTLSGPGAEGRQGQAIPNNVGILGVASHRIDRVLVVEDAGHDQRFDPGIDGRVGVDARSLLYMPLNHQGQLFGMIQLINRQNRPCFTPGDGDITAYVGRQLAQFLQQARMKVDQMNRRP